MLNKKSRFMKLFMSFTLALTLMLPASAMAVSEQETKEVRELLAEYHVSGITEEKLQDKSVEEMLALLEDPYTTYFNSDETMQFLNSVENNFVGIGVRIGEDDQGVYIAEVFPDMPADLAGLQRDDYITAINGNTVEGLTTTEVVNQIMGKENTSVQLTVQRGDTSLNISIQRGVVQVPIVVSKQFDDIGYIELTSFSENGDKLFADALDQMKADEIEALIIDLRNNSGGYMDTAMNIGANFIERGVFVHTNDRNQKNIPSIIEDGKTFDKPVFILMNSYSASASEALAGALRDSAKATIIGTQSFGKGSMQYLMNLSEGGMLKLTTVEYLTPKQTKVNHVGLKPDVEVYGDMPQMLAALRSAGLENIRVQLNKHNASINGVEVKDPFPYVIESGNLYVPSRILASLLGASIEWNGQQNTIDFIEGKNKNSFPLTEGIAIKADSVTYINVAEFAKTFQSVKWSNTGDNWMIEVSKK